jgi:hypothetical protein
LKDSLPAVTVIGYIKNKASEFANWFTGANVGYTGSGWGHGPRQFVADQIGLTGNVSNLFQLGLNSQLQSSQVNLTGDLLERLKKDQAMVIFRNKLIAILKADPRFKNVSFVLAGIQSIEFGGLRAPDDMVEQLKDPFNPAYSATWDVAADPLTWAVRHADVAYTALVKKDGTIVIGYQLRDVLNLRPEGHTGAYKAVVNVVGPLYHDAAGGNDQMKVTADWQETTK